MRPAYLTLAALGNSPWIPVDRDQETISIGVGVILSEDASLTYTVYHTFDPLLVDYTMPCTIARAGTTATVTVPFQHGLTAAATDCFIITNSGSPQLDSQPYPQQIGPPWTSNTNLLVPWDVATTGSTTTLTYTVTNAGPAADAGNARIQIFRGFANASLSAQTIRGNSSYAFPVSAIRIKTSVYAAGFAQLEVVQGGH